MKQATGETNSQPETKYVSIQLRLDGHSFSEEVLDPLAKGKKPVEISVLSAKTLLIPQELFDEKGAPTLMQINGMTPTDSECILHTDPTQPIVALIAVNRTSVDRILTRLGNRIQWTTPLLHSGEYTLPCVWIFRHEELAYLKIWTQRNLRLAEILIAPTAEDLLYYITELLPEMELANCDIRLAGKPTKQDSHLLKEYFKHVTVCE